MCYTSPRGPSFWESPTRRYIILCRHGAAKAAPCCAVYAESVWPCCWRISSISLDDRGEPIYPNTRRQGGNWKEDGQKNFTMFLAAPAQETHTLTFTVVDWPEEPGDYYGTGEVDNIPVLGTYTLNLD